MDIYFSDDFGVSEALLEEYGAFNISLVTDLPLFVDPFLLFNSERPEYQRLHDDIIRYLRFLRDKSEQDAVPVALLKAWYYFGEVKQNWLGFSREGNRGRGLGKDFAQALHASLAEVFRDFGREQITRASHLEKLCLIPSGVGRDMVSDFTTNLIKDYLLEYTSTFAREHIADDLLRDVSVPRAYFSFKTERWMPKRYRLPVFRGDFVLMTPKDILTRDDTWISHGDMVRSFEDIPFAVDNDQLRAEVNNYFYSMMSRDRKSTKEERDRAVLSTLMKYPVLIDYYIRLKEDQGDEAAATSVQKVAESDALYVKQFGALALLLRGETRFYDLPGNTEQETIDRIRFFKDVIENKGAHRLFYVDGKPVRREKDVQIMFRLVWRGTPSDVSREVNDGRGPADFKISRGAADKTLVEFKLASNPQLKRNLEKQLETYKKASDAGSGFKVIIYFTKQELIRVQGILAKLGMDEDPRIILVDARNDNKPSASRA